MIIYDQDHILIKDYKLVKYMDIHYMRLEMENYDVSISGKDFEIEYYGCDELKMKGKIKVIECHEHGL